MRLVEFDAAHTQRDSAYAASVHVATRGKRLDRDLLLMQVTDGHTDEQVHS